MVAGGHTNTAGGQYSWVPGGMQADARGVYGKGAWASGRFAANGDAQAGELVLRRQTTDATPTVLTSDGNAPGATDQVALPNNSAFACRVLVAARDIGGGNGKAMWDIAALARRDAGPSSVLVSSSPAGAVAPTISVGTTAGWTVAIGADTANGAMSVTVTGAAGATIKWVARVLSVEAVG